MTTSEHPVGPSPRTIRFDETVARLLRRYLKAQGADVVFLLPGGQLAALIQELYREEVDVNASQTLSQGIRVIVPMHESGATYMADGFFRATGRLGVAMVTSGPAATNALTGAINAQHSGSSILLVSGEAPEPAFGRGFLQEGADIRLNIDAIYDAGLKFSTLITEPSNFNALFREALRQALTGRRGAAHISLPVDIGGQRTGPTDMDYGAIRTRYRSSVEAVDVTDVHDTFCRARRPVILLGSGAREALRDPGLEKAFVKYIEDQGIAVMTTPNAKGIFDENHDQSLRVYGFASSMWTRPFLRPDPGDPHDALIVVGSSLHGLSTNRWHEMLMPAGRFIQVDVDPAVIGRAFGVDRGIVCDARAFLTELVRHSDIADPELVKRRKKAIRQIKGNRSPFENEDAYNSDRGDGRMHPAAVMRVLASALDDASRSSALKGRTGTRTGRPDTVRREERPRFMVLVDSGNCAGWVQHYLVTPPRCEVHSALVMAPMGFAVAAVVGAKAGAPDRVAIAVAGDGAFMMHGTEVITAAREKLGAIWIVLIDGDLGMVTQGMAQYVSRGEGWREAYDTWWTRFHVGQFAADRRVVTPDVKRFAESLGAKGYDCSNLEDFKENLSAALEKTAVPEAQPQVLAVRIDPLPVPPYYNPEFQSGGGAPS